MNKKGIGPIGAVFLFLVFLVIWFIWLGGWVNQIGTAVVTKHSFTGIEGFFFSNLNFVILICMLLGMMGWMYFSSE